ncbi:MAG TPA: hypothetical protein PLQ93_06425, partial [Bacteroidia bacterium]|nr:hypothetical protein [Bacteroidia bacterium]
MSLNKYLVVSLLYVFVSSSGFSQSCIEVPVPDPCNGKTYTQGAWGAGNNNPASQYLNSHFSTSFPSGLVIGCGTKFLRLTSPAAVAAFLPSGTTPTSLPTGTLINPGSAYSNVLAGQLVTLILNSTFDSNDPNFSPAAGPLVNYTIASGTFSGMSVGNFINLANSIIGGCSNQYSYSQINYAADQINQNYDGGTINNGFLTCEEPCNVSLTISSGTIQCFGGSTTVNVSGTGLTAPYVGTGTFTRTAGAQSFSVSDARGCTAVASITLTQPSVLNLSSNQGLILCNGGSTSVSISASGGTAPYSGTGTFTRSAGIHSFTVADSRSCSAVKSLTLSQPNTLSISSSQGSILCNGGSATVSISANGGTAPYSGTGTFTRSAGVHSFTVTDANGCSAVKTI